MDFRLPKIGSGKSLAVVVDNAIAAFFFCWIYYQAGQGAGKVIRKDIRDRFTNRASKRVE